jgi:hypothetical protein
MVCKDPLEGLRSGRYCRIKARVGLIAWRPRVAVCSQAVDPRGPQPFSQQGFLSLDPSVDVVGQVPKIAIAEASDPQGVTCLDHRAQFVLQTCSARGLAKVAARPTMPPPASALDARHSATLITVWTAEPSTRDA